MSAPILTTYFALTFAFGTLGQHERNGPDSRATPIDSPLPAVVANDNRTPAGTLTNGVLTLDLRAGRGLWRPHGDQAPALQVEAFGVDGAPLSSPAPLIRVPAGTEIALSVRNELTSAIRIHGLCDRGGDACAPIDVAPSGAPVVRFVATRPGTYQYWATSTGMPLQFRASEDAQLSGAFVVDPPGVTPGDERVFVITEWTSLTRSQLRRLAAEDDPGVAFLKLKPDAAFMINGRAWPHTERLHYRPSERVRWRVINLSTQVHPMHLHGFYFDVDSMGDGRSDRVFAEGRKPRVVTQVLQPGSTMAMTWTPERAGNWLFHCHVMTHVSPTLHVDGTARDGHADHGAHDPGAGMTGMVLGITVASATGLASESSGLPAAPPRKLTLAMQPDPKRYGDAPAYGFVMMDRAVGRPLDRVPVPGPTLVLTRGEPVEITLINRLAESTAIHWHGMELESYYDGVHGWSGDGQRVTPLIEPGGSFVVRFSPPRTGTFMYHTHLHDNRQLTSGLYGALLVVEPGAVYDDAIDHVMVIGRGGPDRDAPAVVNGDREPVMVWKAGSRHRIRLINITPGDIFSVSLQAGDTPVQWQPLTKDGVPVPPDAGTAAPAKQIIAVGETYDFEYQAPPGRQTLWLEVRTPGGRWHVQGRVIVK